MGLDAVELIMDIEDAFDISISDAQATRIRTVGELFDSIVEQHRDVATARNVCLSGATFYLIRRTVCAELGLNPKTVRPTVTLESSIPRNHRGEIWAALQSSLKLKLPHLVRPARLVTVATAASIAISIGAGIVFSQATGAIGAGWVSLAMLLLTAIVAREITTPWQTEFHPRLATYGSLSKSVLAHNYRAISRQFDVWNTADAWCALKAIIVEQLGVQPEMVTREASFARDLGLD
jgi:acyl carrier protein